MMQKTYESLAPAKDIQPPKLGKLATAMAASLMTPEVAFSRDGMRSPDIAAMEAMRAERNARRDGTYVVRGLRKGPAPHAEPEPTPSKKWLRKRQSKKS